MSFLIDTNVISGVRRGARCIPGMARWWAEVAEGDLWLSTQLIAEFREGNELAPRRDPDQS